MAKTIVLDTNILIRALLGEKVPSFLNKYVNSCDFITTMHTIREKLCTLVLRGKRTAVSTASKNLCYN